MAGTTGQALAERMRAALGTPPPGGRSGDDGFRAGDPAAAIDRIIVAQSPSVAVLQHARAGERTLFVTREDPFYQTNDTAGSTPNMDWSNGLPAELAVNPLIAAKRTLIAGSGAVCYRISGAWDKARPDAQSVALARAIGVAPVPGPEKSAAYGTVAAVSLARFGEGIAARLKLRSMRAAGDPKLTVRRIAVLNGLVEIPRLARTLADPAVDAVVLGETCEWEATPYFDDLITEGRKVGMLLVGYQTSDRFGMAAVADFVRPLAGGLPVEDAEPGWIA